MKVTILGCGSSGGVPLIGGMWGDCDPKDSRNRRTRASILVEHKNTTILIDTAPDMHQQMLNCQLKTLDAVLYTHAHADHCHGIDDLRSINWLTQKPIDVYAGPVTMAALKERFSYIFRATGRGNFYRPSVEPHEISGPFKVGDISVVPYLQNHGPIQSLGFRMGDFAYSTDVKTLDDNAFDVLSGIKTWVVDCVRYEPLPSHSHLEQTLSWIERVKPERAFLTHMSHKLDYAKLAAELPAGVEPCYDGLVIEC